MAAPSNIRINPFIGDGGTTNYIELVETHIIPSASPFLIRLNEVPQKKDPSNIKGVCNKCCGRACNLTVVVL